MKTVTAIALSVLGLALLGAGRVVVVTCSPPDEKALRQTISRTLPMGFTIEHIDEPSSFLSSRIDVVLTIPGDRTQILDQVENRLRDRGWSRIERQAASVGVQSEDSSVQLTHISKATYRYVETFVL